MWSLRRKILFGYAAIIGLAAVVLGVALLNLIRLGERLAGAIDWVRREEIAKHMSVGLFGASTGAAAALIAAAQKPEDVSAVVSRGGRPDLAGLFLPQVQAPTLLIVGGDDDVVTGPVQPLALGRFSPGQKRIPGEPMDVGIAHAPVMDHQDADVVSGGVQAVVAEQSGRGLGDGVPHRGHQLFTRGHVPADAADIRFDQGEGGFHGWISNG